MNCTVDELFDHFGTYFDEIDILDEEDRVIESVNILGTGFYNADRYCEFLLKYGDYIVVNWLYYHDSNLIEIKIEKAEE